MLQNVVIRVLASFFVAAGSVAIVSWMWPDGADMIHLLRMGVGAVAAGIGVVVLVSLWKR